MDFKSIKPSDDDLALRLESPGFSIPYPILINKELMPPQMLAMLDATWRRECFPPQQVKFHLLRNVVVVHEGLVLDEATGVYQASITQHSEVEIRKGLADAQEAIRTGQAPVHKGTYLLCTKRGTGNYGHWLMEMLPRAFLGSQHFGEIRYVVPTAAPQLASVISTSLELLNIRPDMVLRAGREPHVFEELILIDGLTQHGVLYVAACHCVYPSPVCFGTFSRCGACIRYKVFDWLS